MQTSSPTAIHATIHLAIDRAEREADAATKQSERCPRRAHAAELAMLATSDTVVPAARVLSSRASFVNLTRPSGATSAHGEAGYVGDPSEEKASLASSLVNLANTVVFYGMATAGLVPGLAILVLTAAMGGFALFCLGRAQLKLGTHRQSFTTLGDTVRPRFSVVVELAVICNCLGSAIGYLIVATDNLLSIFGTPGGSSLVDSRRLWTAVSVGIAAPLSLLKTMDALRVTSALAVAILVAVAALVAAVYFEPSDELSPCGTVGDASCVGVKPSFGASGLETFAKFVVFANGFTCQQSLPPILSELEDPTPGRLMALIYGGLAIVVPLYIAVSYFGYMSFGANVASNILNSYPVNPFTTAGRLGVAIVVITSYPTQTFATRKSFANILRTLQGGGEPPKTPPSVFINDDLELRTMLVLLAFTFAVALVVTDLGIMVAITGSTGAAAITFVFPGLFYYVTHGDEPGVLRTAAFALLTFGLVLIPTSLSLTLAGY